MPENKEPLMKTELDPEWVLGPRRKWLERVEQLRREAAGQPPEVKKEEKETAKDAKERVRDYITEAHDEIESTLNRQGLKRAYIKAGRVFFELSYERPPVDWNPETGKPAEGAGAAPEHLMLKLASGKNKVSGKELMEMIRAMYHYKNYREEGYFKSKEAYEEHIKFMKKIEENIEDSAVGKRGKTLHLFSANEREIMEKKGAKFIEQELKK